MLELRLTDLRAARTRRRLLHRGIPFRTDVYDVGEELVIWGATARIVGDLLARAGAAARRRQPAEPADDGPRRPPAQPARRRIADERVLDAMAAVPRELFVAPALAAAAYDDAPLRDRRRPDDLPADGRRAHVRAARAAPERPRARRRHRLGLPRGRPVAAVRRTSGASSSTRSSRCARRARSRRRASTTSRSCAGDGARGLPEHAPFDAINVAATARGAVPPALEQQLAAGRPARRAGRRRRAASSSCSCAATRAASSARGSSPCASSRCADAPNCRDIPRTCIRPAERCTMRRHESGEP